MTSRLSTLSRSPRLGLVALCLLVNGAVFAGVAWRYPEYLSNYRLNESRDALHYVQLGRNLVLEGRYSRSDEPPYLSDFLRTPVYPAVAGSLEVATGPIGLYLFQILLQVGVVLLVHRLAALYFDPRVALWAGLFAATDLMWAVYNFFALTEPLYSSVTFLAVALLLPRLVASDGNDRGRLDKPLVYLACGVLLAIATLTRPAGQYLPWVLAAASAVFWISRRAWKATVIATLCLVLPSLLLVGAWVARNDRLFGVSRVSSVDAVGLVYMAGAGAYQIEHGVSRPRAQEMIVEEFDLPTLLEVQNPWLSERSIAEMDHDLREALPKVLGKYPASLVRSSVVALVRGSLSHDARELAALHERDWAKPGLSGGGGKLEALAKLFSNHPSHVAAFFWQVAHAIVVLGLAICGMVALLASRTRRKFALVLLLVIAYFGAGMAVFGVDAYYRARMPMLPYLYLLAGVAAAALLDWLRPSRGTEGTFG